MKNSYIFISHSTKYNELVRTLCRSMEIEGLNTRVDPRETEPAGELEPDIKQAIEQAGAFIAVIGPDTIKSSRILKETGYALEMKRRYKDEYKVITLVLAGIKPAEISSQFGHASIGTQIQISSGGIKKAISELFAILSENLSKKREKALHDDIENSMQQLSPGIREKITPLGVFQGGGSISIIANVLKLNEAERDLLVSELLEIKLAKTMLYGFLRFHPALCPYLLEKLDDTTLGRSRDRLSECLRQLGEFLYKQQSEDTELADSLTLLELPNLIKSLEYVQEQAVPELTLDRASILEQLIAQLDKPDILSKVKTIQEEEEKRLAEWGSPRFETLKIQVERLLEIGNLPQALSVAQIMLDKCLKAGDRSYNGSDYDTAEAYVILGRVLNVGGASENALQAMNEAHKRFARIAKENNSEDAGRMVAVSLAKKGECLLALDRLEEAAASYEESIHVAEEIKSEKHIAIGKGLLGAVRMYQGRYDDALKAHNEAREIFEGIGDLNMVAVAFQQMAVIREEIGQFEEAEQAYRQSLIITEQQKNPLDTAKNMGRLGSFYSKTGRSEDAVHFFQRSAEKYMEINDMANEGRARGNLTITLIALQRYEEARQEIQRAIECFKPYGHNVEPWKAWDKLCEIEQEEGNREAADIARQKTIQLFLAFRRDGGMDDNPGGRLCALFEEAMEKQPPEEVQKHLDEVAKDPNTPAPGKLLVSKLQYILTGSRETEMALDPDLEYVDAAELLFLLERLQKRAESQ